MFLFEDVETGNIAIFSGYINLLLSSLGFYNYKKGFYMKNKYIITSIISASIALTFFSVNVEANNCAISINSKESIKCLQRKISSLEKRLEQSKLNQFAFPKSAIVDFNAKSCPVGWSEFQELKSSIVNTTAGNNIVKCQKS